MPRLFRAALAVFLCTWVPLGAAADSSATIAGFVVDEVSHRPLPGARLAIVRLPHSEGAAYDSATADRHGFFANIGLQPGRYAVTADVRGRKATCVIEDLAAGQIRRLHILVSALDGTFQCLGPRVRPALVDSDETADVTRIR